MRGSSGGTKTSIFANCDRIPGSPCGPGLTWLESEIKINVYLKNSNVISI